jgi:thiamine biosynthesis protein ThiS
LQVSINGDSKTFDSPVTLSELIDQLQLTPSRVAIELNRVVVRRSEWSATSIKEGDKIEIVHFVGGGVSV